MDEIRNGDIVKYVGDGNKHFDGTLKVVKSSTELVKLSNGNTYYTDEVEIVKPAYGGKTGWF